jgi:hypothetical protein
MGEEELFHTHASTHEGPLEEIEEGPLVERLRRLEWPAVDPELRQRSWNRFEKLMADLDGSGSSPRDGNR